MQHSQSTPTVSAIQDIEWSSGLSRASGQGAKFALLLAMLERDILLRPTVIESSPATVPTECVPEHHYRPAALQAEGAHFDTALATNRLLGEQGVADARLWQSMHPDPLSLQNDAYHIDAAVVANMSWAAQQRFNHPVNPQIDADETGLYDVLQQINPLAEMVQSQ